MDTALYLLTGLNEHDRKLFIYYTLATHTLDYVDKFPLLVPTPATLLRACTEVAYEDAVIAKLRKDLREGG